MKAVSRNFLSDTKWAFLFPVAGAAAGSRPTYLEEESQLKEGPGLAAHSVQNLRVKHRRKTACLGSPLSELWTYNKLSCPDTGQGEDAHPVAMETTIMPHPRNFGSKHTCGFTTFLILGPIFVTKTKMPTLSIGG